MRTAGALERATLGVPAAVALDRVGLEKAALVAMATAAGVAVAAEVVTRVKQTR